MAGKLEGTEGEQEEETEESQGSDNSKRPGLSYSSL